MDLFNYKRRKSSVVGIGNTPMGGDYPIRIQSMTNTSTMDTEGSADQCIRIIEAGGEYVRLTAQGVREAENLENIKKRLRERGYQTPLIADIHFNPKAAEAAARVVEKVRINPGNFVDPVKTFARFEYTDEEYLEEIKKIEKRFIPFLDICKEYKTAIRIGVNHGSLSDRIMSRYGDTPEGMTESCMEFLRICVKENFNDVVISIKASNTIVMSRTVRLLVRQMDKENMAFPLHLGVTEAGDGEDGRIKSAVGIGALLSDGIGDTVRVSLSEDPEKEIPVARKLVDYVLSRADHPEIPGNVNAGYDPVIAVRRKSRSVKNIGGTFVPVVISDRTSGDFDFTSASKPDYVWLKSLDDRKYLGSIPAILNFEQWENKENCYPCFSTTEITELISCDRDLKFLFLCYEDLTEDVISVLKKDGSVVVLLETGHINGVGEQRAFFHMLLNENCDVPVIICRKYKEKNTEDLHLKSAVDVGTLFLDGWGDGIMVSGQGIIPPSEIDSGMFGILQAVRQRISKTDYISCPSCGRTLFDLQSAIRKIKDATSHLTGLKIGIMGCIVNGPGEMADADYGYVGAGVRKISLYKGKECVEKNIPEESAVDRLIELIKKHGDWKENVPGI